jgi:uncharacterized membrane protein
MQSSKLKSLTPPSSPATRPTDTTVFGLWMWTVLGAGLRFFNLTAKPPWTDEFATLTFSLGNSYLPIPLNEPITVAELLTPLQTNLGGSLGDVFARLIAEDNHPPLFFGLLHLWLHLFPQGEYISLWAARSLPALFGVLAIPAIYGLAKMVFRSRAIAQASAALMAISPYGIYLAQEARHYTMGVLFVIASLFCLFAAIKHVWRGTRIPLRLMLLWAAMNSLGFITHYFFVLTLLAETSVLFLFLAIAFLRGKNRYFYFNAIRLSVAGSLTAIFGLTWKFVILPPAYGSTMTDWIQNNNSSLLEIVSPIFQLAGTLIPMLFLLPIESSFLPIVILSAAVMLLFLIWLLPLLKWGSKVQLRQPKTRLGMQVMFAFIGSAIAIFLIITYIAGIDITRGSRYSFVYFPAIILILGAILAACWQRDTLRFQLKSSATSLMRRQSPLWLYRNGKLSAIAIAIMAFASALTVTTNLGYQKYYRPDLFMPILAQSKASSVLIATTHETLVQTGELMGIGWLLKEHPLAEKTQFLLAHQPQKNSKIATETLQKTLQKMPRSLDLWLVNFHAPIELNDCTIEPQQLPAIDGYQYQLYHCPEVSNMRAQDQALE